MSVIDIEKLGAFYLGRRHDLESGETSDVPVLYDSRDLTTHAVCVGMTGSGKTGLCVSLLEEAAIDGVPALAIDPKGDLGNLALTFPGLTAEEFRPWINEDEARRKQMSPDDFAASQADLWRNGLAKWGQGPERIRRLRQAAETRIYTPGSEAGLPVSILASFAAPPEAGRLDGDGLRDRVAATTSSLLGLMGVKADPLRSREHILISNLFDHAWRRGQDLDLPALIRTIQEPPIDRIGVLDMDAFFAPDDRFELAMRLNNLLASPGFSVWMQGEPLDVQKLLYTPEGRPRIAVISIAHLGDAERMFVVSLLLGQMLSWMRSKPGTTSLRALLYMDEIFGYCPPIGEPPSKKPLLTLLKQARAHGLGVVLATQNPVDLDYKGLSNTGTWMIGRMQTERDKARVMEGLESLSGGFSKQRTEKTISGLGKRVFMLHNVHEEAPTIFHTRWAMSYLRGPLTRDHIRTLTRDHAPASPAAPASAAAMARPATGATPAAEWPLLPPRVPQTFLPARIAGEFVYEPRLLGLGRVHFVDRKSKKEVHRQEIAWLLPITGESIDWTDADTVDVVAEELENDPEPDRGCVAPDDAAGDPAHYRAWKKQFSDTLYRTCGLDLMRSPTYGLVSEPGENEGDFRVRLGEQSREKRDRAADTLRRKYERRASRLEDRIRRAAQKVDVQQEQASGQKMQTAISFGTTLLSAFLGSKALSRGTLGRATTAARSVARGRKEKQDVQRAQENLDSLQAQLQDLERELEEELAVIDDRFDPLAEELEVATLRPRRADVEVRLVSLAWVPVGNATD